MDKRMHDCPFKFLIADATPLLRACLELFLTFVAGFGWLCSAGQEEVLLVAGRHYLTPTIKVRDDTPVVMRITRLSFLDFGYYIAFKRTFRKYLLSNFGVFFPQVDRFASTERRMAVADGSLQCFKCQSWDECLFVWVSLRVREIPCSSMLLPRVLISISVVLFQASQDLAAFGSSEVYLLDPDGSSCQEIGISRSTFARQQKLTK